MNRNLRRVVATISCAALMGASVCTMARDVASSPDDDSGAMLADLVFVRPLSLVGTVLGAAVFVVALPFTLPSRSVEKTADRFVAKPFEYTFIRRLGDFDQCGATHQACGED